MDGLVFGVLVFGVTQPKGQGSLDEAEQAKPCDQDTDGESDPQRADNSADGVSAADEEDQEEQGNTTASDEQPVDMMLPGNMRWFLRFLARRWNIRFVGHVRSVLIYRLGPVLLLAAHMVHGTNGQFSIQAHGQYWRHLQATSSKVHEKSWNLSTRAQWIRRSAVPNVAGMHFLFRDTRIHF